MDREEFITAIILLGFAHTECSVKSLTHYDSPSTDLRIKLDTGSNTISLWNTRWFTYINQLQKGLGHDYQVALENLIPYLNKNNLPFG